MRRFPWIDAPARFLKTGTSEYGRKWLGQMYQVKGFVRR